MLEGYRGKVHTINRAAGDPTEKKTQKAPPRVQAAKTTGQYPAHRHICCREDALALSSPGWFCSGFKFYEVSISMF